MTTELIEIRKIEKNDDRKMGGQGNLQGLARDLEKNGQINPVSVIKTESGYRIITGRRRLAAGELIGWEKIRATVYETDELNETQETGIALSENVNREEMDAIDEGKLFAFLMEQEGKSAAELAETYNRSVSAIYQRAKLDKLSEEWQYKIKEEKIKIEAAAKVACLSPEIQKKVFEACDKLENWTSWSIDREIAKETNTVLGRCFYCEECEKCRNRTHFEDMLLFPELNGRENYCFNSDCYQQTWKESIDKQFEAYLKEENEIRNIILFSEKNDVPEIIKMNTTDGKGLQIGEELYPWYTPEDAVIIYPYTEGNLDEYFKERLFQAVLMKPFYSDASYSFEPVKLMLKKDKTAYDKTVQEVEKERTRTEIFLDELPEQYQKPLEEIKRKYRTYELQNRATELYADEILKRTFEAKGNNPLSEEMILKACGLSKEEKEEIDEKFEYDISEQLIRIILKRKILKNTISAQSIINSDGIIAPDVKAVYNALCQTEITQAELLDIAKEAMKEAILEV